MNPYQNDVSDYADNFGSFVNTTNQNESMHADNDESLIVFDREDEL